jgi:hypothetical protein
MFLQDSAKASAAEAMKAAMSKRNVLSKCKQDAAKTALVSSLGKMDVKDNEVESFVRDAAKTAVADAMVAAMSDTNASPEERREAAKQALAQTLGESAEEIDDTSFELFKNKGAVSVIGDAMKSCSSAASLEETEALKQAKLDKCLSKNAKVALQQALGSTSEPSEVEVKKYVAKAGKSSAVDSRKSCMKAADGNSTKMILCTSDLSELKETIKSSNGGADITAETAEAFVMSGAVSKASEEMISCYRVSKSDQSTLDECKASIAGSVGTFLGKPLEGTRRRLRRNLVGDIKRTTDVQAEEIKTDGVSEHLLDVIKACYDSEVGESGKKACFSNMVKNKEAVEEASGTASVSPVAIQRMKKMAQIKVLKATNEALHGSNTTGSAVKEDLKVYGIDFDAERLKVSEIASRAGSLQVALTAIACDAAGTPSNDCKFGEAREKAVGKGSHGRRLMADSAPKIKREGAEELLARKILAQFETVEGVPSSGNGDAVDGPYKLLRDTKHRDADVAQVKAKLAGEYMVDCLANNGTTFEACKKDAAIFLKNDIHGKRPIDDSLVHAQFTALAHSASCVPECSNEMSLSVSKLGLVTSEIGARKVSAAITIAANTKADCMDVSGKKEADCEAEAKQAFKRLGVKWDYDKSEYLKRTVNALAGAKETGKVTEMRKFRATNTVASYPKKCDSAITEQIKREIDKAVGGSAKTMYTVIDVEEEVWDAKTGFSCEILLSTSFNTDVEIEDIEAIAKQMRPTLSVKGRRLADYVLSVSTSSSLVVTEVDPDNVVNSPGPGSDYSDGGSNESKQKFGLILALTIGGIIVACCTLGACIVYKSSKPKKKMKNYARKSKNDKAGWSKNHGLEMRKNPLRGEATQNNPVHNMATGQKFPGERSTKL